MSGEYTIDEVSLHNTEFDAWIIIHQDVYDITEFLNEHPGGKHILMTVVGGDATEFFEELRFFWTRTRLKNVKEKIS